MKASDIIKDLEKLVEKHGDLDVRLYCDHGQSMMGATEVCTCYIDEDQWMAEHLDEEDLEDYPDAIKVIEINAC